MEISMGVEMKWFLFVLIVLLSVSTFAQETEDSDSGIQGPKYSEILETMEKWQSNYPSITKLEQYGTSVKGKPLKMLIVGKNQKKQNRLRPTLVMSGSTHGNEYLNIEDRLPEILLNDSKSKGPVKNFIENDGVFIFIPILNPDGYDARKRENANGEDLNRDWDVKAANFKGFKEAETKTLASKINSLKSDLGLKLEVTVDYHCCIGAILYPWSYTSKPVPAHDLTSLKAMGNMADNVLDIESGTTGQILGYYPTGTSKDYYYESHGALAFNYEGRYGKEDKLIDEHVTWWREMVEFVNASQWMKSFEFLPVRFLDGFDSLRNL